MTFLGSLLEEINKAAQGLRALCLTHWVGTQLLEAQRLGSGVRGNHVPDCPHPTFQLKPVSGSWIKHYLQSSILINSRAWQQRSGQMTEPIVGLLFAEQAIGLLRTEAVKGEVLSPWSLEIAQP